MTLSRSQLSRLRLELERRYKLPASGGEHFGVRSPQGPVYRNSRPWEPGDPVTKLDMTQYAKTGQLHVREFDADPTIRIVVVADYSDQLSGGSSQALTPKSGMVLAACEAISFISSHQRDKVGMLVGSSTPLTVPVGSKITYVQAALQQAQLSSEDHFPSLLKLAGIAKPFRAKLVVVVSTFRREGWQEQVRLLSMSPHREVIALQIRDAWDTHAEPRLGWQVVNGRRVNFADPDFCRRYTQAASQWQASVESTLASTPRVRHVQVTTSQDLVDQLAAVLDRNPRKRRSHVVH